MEFHITHPELDDRPNVIVHPDLIKLARQFDHEQTVKRIKELAKIPPDTSGDCKINCDDLDEDCECLNPTK